MGTIKDIVDLTTQLATSVSDRKVADELNKIQSLTLQLQSELVDLYEKNMRLHEELRLIQSGSQKDKDEIKRLQESLEEKGNIQYEKPSYWRIDGDSKDGPFCQRCYDAETKLVRLQGGKNDYWLCRECKSFFYGPKYVASRPRVVGSLGSRSKW